MDRLPEEHRPYYRLTAPARFDKAINSLLGIIEGIAVDQRINDRELRLLRDFVREHRRYENRHPFNEILPTVAAALADEVLSTEERDDITSMCERLRGTGYYDVVTADIQRLHAIVGAIAADGVVSPAEIAGLSTWLEEHEALRSCWPYDEIDTLVTQAMRTEALPAALHEELRQFFLGFLGETKRTSGSRTTFDPTWTVRGVCATCPDIRFVQATFCFTGRSPHMNRARFAELIRSRGGRPVDRVSPEMDYLVIGAAGNPCWAYACYGRKVEEAVRLRRAGHHLLIVHENDVHDALADA